MENCLKMKYVNYFLLFALNFNIYAFDYQGNVKFYNIFKDLPSTEGLNRYYQLSNKNQVLFELNSEFKFEVGHEVFINIEKPVPHRDEILNYRIIDFKNYLHDSSPSNEYEYLLSHNLNRFNISYSTPLFDFTLGRTPISFGSAKTINPTDFVAPISFNTIDKEERTGVDSLVFKIPINALSLVELGTIWGEDLKNNKSAIYLRPKLNWNENDFSLTLSSFKEKKLIGFDWQRPIDSAGFWLEAAYVDLNARNYQDFLRVTTGVDYKFSNTLYLAGEYHFNGKSQKLPNRTLPLDFIYLRDRDYFILTSSYEFTPLITGNLQSYYNFKDESTLTMLKADYNFKENFYFSLGIYNGVGDEIFSEFGRLGQTYFLNLRLYY